MLQEFLRRGKKWADKPDSNLREGTSTELGICSRPVWVSAYGGKSSKRSPWKWWIFRWIFAVDFLGRKIQKKNPPKKILPKNPPAENKKSAVARPPRIHQPGPKIRRKTYQQIRLSNLQVHTGLFSIEKAWSWRRFQSMDSRTLFGCLLGMVEAPMLKCTWNPSAAAGRRDKVCCAPFQPTLLVKNFRFEKTAPKYQKTIRHATLPTLAAQQSITVTFESSQNTLAQKKESFLLLPNFTWTTIL